MNTIMNTITTIAMSRFLKMICALAVVSSALSCSKDYGEGTPYMLFEIHGKVVDVDGNPIEGIYVSSGMTEVEVTNMNGNFTYFGRSVPSSTASLTFEDKDGEENGGDFQKTVRNITMNQKTPGSKSGSFKGTYFAQGVEIVMILKEDELNPDSGLIPLSSLQD